jgi:BASS family bile acid:Na+ symporter
MLARYLLVWLSLSSLLAYVWPRVLPLAPDPFVWGKSTLSYAITATMFAIGWMLPTDEVNLVARRWPTVLGGTATQYTAMPLLALAFGRLFQLDTEGMLGLLMVGCVPGAMASNVLTLNARGNTSYSVALTTSATLLSPLMVPLALSLALADMPQVTLDGWGMARGLLLTIVVPVVTGHLLGRRFPAWEPIARRIGSAIANLVILWIIAVVVGMNRDRLPQLTPYLFLALLGVNLFGYAAGYGSGLLMHLPAAMRRALTLEVGMQNAGLGAFLATEFFPQYPSAAIPPALYTFGCMFTGTVLASMWARSAIVAPLPHPTGESTDTRSAGKV